jgi:hypothetical protein
VSASSPLSPEVWKDWLHLVEVTLHSTAFLTASTVLLSACTAMGPPLVAPSAADLHTARACMDVLLRSADLCRSMLALASAANMQCVHVPEAGSRQAGVIPGQAVFRTSLHLLYCQMDLCACDPGHISHWLDNIPDGLRDSLTPEIIGWALVARCHKQAEVQNSRMLRDLNGLDLSGQGSQPHASQQYTGRAGQYSPPTYQWGTLKQHHNHQPTTSSSIVPVPGLQYRAPGAAAGTSGQHDAGTSSAPAAGTSAGPSGYHQQAAYPHHPQHTGHLYYSQQHQGVTAGPSAVLSAPVRHLAQSAGGSSQQDDLYDQVAQVCASDIFNQWCRPALRHAEVGIR